MVNKKDYKLFASLVLWALIPSLYLLIRMHIVAVTGVDINIMGQMEWFDLVDETIVTTLTVPLYYLLNATVGDKNRSGRAFVISFGIYTIITAILAVKCSTIAEFMNAGYATRYLILQSFALLIGFISTFMIILLTINDDYNMVFMLTVIRLVFLIFGDLIFIPRFFDEGASYSEIIVNTLIATAVFVLTYKRGYIGFGKCEMSWVKDWTKIGIWSGCQIVLANVVYALIVVRMINAVSESGNYWVANNFIWGWLLVPVNCFAEIIKKNKLEKLDIKNSWRYCATIIAVWIISVPSWNWFLNSAMAVDANTVLKIVYPVMPFYVAYMISQIIEGWFISRGKTIYNAIVSAAVNIIYYGVAYLMFQRGVFTMDISFIIGLFGWGMVFVLIFDIFFYIYESKRKLIIKR